MKIFSLFFYIGLISFILVVFGFIYFGGFTNLFEFYTSFVYTNFSEYSLEEFDLYFYFYLIIFFSVFFTFWGGLMAGKIKMVFSQLILGSIFITIGYFVETVRFSFYIAGIINLIIFFYLIIKLDFFSNQIGFIKKIKEKSKEEFKLNAIKREGEFVDFVDDYSMKINNRPGKKAIYKVIHPLTDKEIFVESESSFDKYFMVNNNQNINVYFDRNNEKKYILDNN